MNPSATRRSPSATRQHAAVRPIVRTGQPQAPDAVIAASRARAAARAAERAAAAGAIPISRAARGERQAATAAADPHTSVRTRGGGVAWQAAASPSARPASVRVGSSAAQPLVTRGNVAVAVAAQPAPQERPSRAPLTVAAPAPVLRPKPKTRYAVITVIAVALMALGQLGLSILLSSGAYELAQLRGESRQLEQTARALNEDLALLSSPQALAKSASALGMVQASNPAYLRLSDGKVLGAPKAASADRKASAWAATIVPNSLLGGFLLPVLQAGNLDAEGSQALLELDASLQGLAAVLDAQAMAEDGESEALPASNRGNAGGNSGQSGNSGLGSGNDSSSFAGIAGPRFR